MDNERYDPWVYWNRRENPINSNKVNREISEFLKRGLRDRREVFELGAGTGRLFPFYSGKSLTTLDLSRGYESECLRRAEEYDVSINQNFYDDPLSPFPFQDRQFEVSLAVQVLIHVPFYAIDHTFKELLRVSKELIVISGYNKKWPNRSDQIKRNQYCFNHDYIDLVERCGASIVEYKFTQSDRVLAWISNEREGGSA